MDTLAGKKVLFLITKSNWGGAQSYVFTLAKNLHDQGVEVAVCCGGADGKTATLGLLASRLQEADIRVIPLPSIMRDISLISEVRACWQLYRILKKEKPDVLHINSSKAGVIGSFCARLATIPKIIFTAHGWPHREKRNVLMKLLIRAGSWITILFSHVVIAVSELDLKTAPVFFRRKKIVMIHNGVSTFPLLPRHEAREKLGAPHPELSASSYWILIIAELTKNKALDVALRSLAKMSDTKKHVQMIVLGSGEEKERLQKQIQVLGLEQDVFLLGFTPDARSYLLAGDCLLLPSRKEGLPMTILEAGIASLPTIATNVGAIPEIIQSGENGLLIGPDDVSALAEGLTQIVNDPEMALRLGERLHETVLADFTEEEMVSKTISLYA